MRPQKEDYRLRRERSPTPTESFRQRWPGSAALPACNGRNTVTWIHVALTPSLATVGRFEATGDVSL